MLGSMVRRDPGVAKDVAAAGHEIGVHGDVHGNMLRRTPWHTDADVTAAFDTVAEATGTRPEWFRPPFGIQSAASLRAARRLGMRTVLWTTWGRDWRKEATPDTVVAEAARGVAMRTGGQ